MSAAESGLGTVFSIRASLDRFASDLRASEQMASNSARKVQADAQRVANEKQIVMRIRTEALSTNLDADMRRQFAATGGTPSTRGASSDASSLLDTTIKVGLVLKTIQGTITIVQGLSHVWAANVAEAAGNHRKAAEEMIRFSEAATSLPLIGQMLDKLSGGAIEAAKQALSDADKIDQKTAMMVKDRAANEAALAQQAAVNRAQRLEGVEKEQQLESLRHAAAIKAIDDEVKAKKIGAGAANEAKAAETIATQEKQRQLSIDKEIAQTQGTFDAVAGDISAGVTPVDEDLRVQFREKSEQEIREMMVESVEFEKQLRLDLLAAEKEGVNKLAEQRELNAQKSAARELELARRVEDEKLRLAMARLESEQHQREAINDIRQRNEAEQREGALTAQGIQIEAAAIREQVAQRGNVAEVLRIQQQLQSVIEGKGRDFFGNPLERPEVIAAARARADAQLEALALESEARRLVPLQGTGGAGALMTNILAGISPGDPNRVQRELKGAVDKSNEILGAIRDKLPTVAVTA